MLANSENEQTGKRWTATRRRTTLAAVVLICLTATVLLCIGRIRISAWAWHLRHSTITVGEFVVPVPKNWYAEDEHQLGYLLVKLDTDDITPTKRLKAHASILFTAPRHQFTESEVQRMTSMEENWLVKGGSQDVSTQSITIGRDTLLCVGGNRLATGGLLDADPKNWICRASGGLEMFIGATDPDMKQVWEIVSGIRRTPSSAGVPPASADHPRRYQHTSPAEDKPNHDAQ